MSENGNILIFAEHDEGRLERVGLELISKARVLADDLGVFVSAVIIGDCVKPLADDLCAYGADSVYVADSPSLREYHTIPYAQIVVDLIRETAPQIVLYGATPLGRDLAPRVAGELRVGLTADCTELRIGDHKIGQKQYSDILYQIRPAFGGNIVATIVSPDHRPQMATVRSGVMPLGEKTDGRSGQVIDIDLPDLSTLQTYTLVNRVSSEKKVDLLGANIVVAGGIGVGTRESFVKHVVELARILGGVPAASRAAVDAGFIDHDYQVGQTGTTVRPKLYIACGISGQIQHRAGMMESGKIIAINSDPNAPIFGIAHYGIVGDLQQVVPLMINAYRSKAD